MFVPTFSLASLRSLLAARSGRAAALGAACLASLLPSAVAGAAETSVRAEPVAEFSGRETAEASEGHEDHETYSHALEVRVAFVESRHGQEPILTSSVADGTEEGILSRHPAVGMAYEQALVHGWLNVEVAASLMPGHEGLGMPTELLLKLPFELSEEGEIFAGVGGAVDLMHQAEAGYAAVAAAGFYYWPSPNYGLAVATEFVQSLREPGSQELSSSAGVVSRF